MCDHFRIVAGRPNVDTPDAGLRASTPSRRRDTVTLYLDTFGRALYKRGFKPAAAVEALLKENPLPVSCV